MYRPKPAPKRYNRGQQARKASNRSRRNLRKSSR